MPVMFDQVSLPPSAERELTRQDASRNGAMLFELSSGKGRTHVGVLDFTAPEASIQMPPAVALNLWGPKGAAAGQDVTITYSKLQQGDLLAAYHAWRYHCKLCHSFDKVLA